MPGHAASQESEPRQSHRLLYHPDHGANELVGSIHDRMPVILNPADYDLSLDPDVQDAKRLEPLLVPYTSEVMGAYPVRTLVNNPKADDPRCVAPAGQGPNDAR